MEHPVAQGTQATGGATAALGRRDVSPLLSLAAGTWCVIVLGLEVQGLILQIFCKGI